MGFLQKKIKESSSRYPATAVMRNYLNSSPAYAYRVTEYNQGGRFFGGLYVTREPGREEKLFSMSKEGPKNDTMEFLFRELSLVMDRSGFVTQSDDLNIAMETSKSPDDKQVNVIITGTEEEVKQVDPDPVIKWLEEWSSSEPYFNFSNTEAPVMARWFPMDTVRVSTQDSAITAGGLKKYWRIPEDLVKGNFNDINIMPMRGFVYGRYDLEFKIVLQANPFQAGCIMLSLIPNPYGLTSYRVLGTPILPPANDHTSFPADTYSSEKSYMDSTVAVQRPHIMVDVSAGGSGLLRLNYKYNKTLLHNFDFNSYSGSNPGVRGSYMAGLALHVMSSLVVGEGNENYFDARVFYRFVDSRLTGMTQLVNQRPGTISAPILYNPQYRKEVWKNIKADRATAREKNKQYETQGAIMSAVAVAKGVVDVASDVIGVTEKIGTKTRKGFGARNRDKPNDVVSAVRNNPRPRANFNYASGTDDAVTLAMHWDELTEFFEIYNDEPKNFKDLCSITGLMTRTIWATTDLPGHTILHWKPQPTIKPNVAYHDYEGNVLDPPTMVASSMFTNYCGTIELYFQFVKTQFHKGAINVSMNFGRTAAGDGLHSSYVKVLNVQECAGFKVTVPYIYDTPMQFTGGTSNSLTSLSWDPAEIYALVSDTEVTVSVLNELVAPGSVAPNIEILVWMKGGNDFALTYPRQANNILLAPRIVGPASGDRLNNLILNPVVGNHLGTNRAQPQMTLDKGGKLILKEPLAQFATQSDDDFRQLPFTENRQTTRGHMDFKDILKMPVKIISNYPVHARALVEMDYSGTKTSKEFQSYVNIPVAPISTSLVQFLDDSIYGAALTGITPPVGKYNHYGMTGLQQSIQHQICRMFGMYRGTINYTIVTEGHTDDTSPINYVYFPHDYALRRLQGPDGGATRVGDGVVTDLTWQGIPGMGTDLDLDSAFSSPYHGFIIPRINSTEKLSIPHSSVNNWLNMNRRLYSSLDKNNSQLSVSMPTMRENSEWFNGTLRIWSGSNFNLSVYVSAGDDVELGGFLGTPPCHNPYAAYAQQDTFRGTWATQGLDFNLKELTSKGWNSVIEISKYTLASVGMATLSSAFQEVPQVASVTGAILLFSVFGGLDSVSRFRNSLNTISDPQVKRAIMGSINQVGGITEDVKKLIDKGSDLVSVSEEAITGLTHHGVQAIETLIVEYFPKFSAVAGLKVKMWSIAQNLVHAALAQNWKNGAWAIFNIFVEFGLLDVSSWKSMGPKLSDLIGSIMPEGFLTQADTAWTPLVEILATAVFGKLQVDNCGGFRMWATEIFKYQNYKNVSGMNGLMNIVRNLMRCISSLWDWATAVKDPNLAMYETLLKHDEELAKFMEEGNLYLSSFNNSDFKSKSNRIRFLHTILRALKLRLILLKINQPRVTGQLLAFCEKVLKKADEQKYLMKCDIVKEEPFVLCLSGGSNIGKSFSVLEISTQMLESINYKHSSSDVVFTIPSGVDFWNGYDDQPVVWYDDWCNFRDDQTARAHIGQLYALKTSAVFNVPRAELENKEQIASPKLVMLTTNNPFPRSSIFVEPTAVYRRRDLMVKMTLADGKGISDFSQEELAKYEHIRMQFYENPTQEKLEPAVYTFQEGMERIKKTYVEYNKKELANKETKYNILLRNVRTTKIDNVELKNPFELLETMEIEEEELMTTQRLERRVDELMLLLQPHFTSYPEGKLPPSDDEIFDTEGLQEVVTTIYNGVTSAIAKGKTYALEKTSGIREKIHAQYRKMDNFFYRCYDCSAKAAYNNMLVKCLSGEPHYFCVKCAMRQERHGEEVFCKYHNRPLTFDDYDWTQAVAAELLGNLVYTPENILSSIEFMFGDRAYSDKAKFMILTFIGANIALTYATVAATYAAKIFKIVYVKTPGSTFYVQGNDPEQLAGTSANHERIRLEKEAAWVPPVHGFMVEEVYKDDKPFPSSKISALAMDIYRKRPPTKTKYVCAHSLLCDTFHYADGQYHVSGFHDNSEFYELIIPDQKCEGRCVLLNIRFLRLMASKFETSGDIIEAYRLKDLFRITKSVPRFTIPKSYGKLRALIDQTLSFTTKPWWETYISPIGDFFVKHGRTIGCMLTVGGMIWGFSKVAKKTWQLIMQLFGLDMDIQGYVDSDPDESKKSRDPRHPNGKGKNKNKGYRTQALNQSLDDKIDKACANYIILTTPSSKVGAWGMCNSVFLMPKHQLAILKGRDSIGITFPTRPQENFVHSVEKLIITEIPEKDLCLVRIDGCKPLFKDCRSLMNKRPSDVLKTEAVMVELDNRTGDITDVKTRIISRVSNTTATNPSGDEYRTDQGWLYDYQKKGACGSLLFVDDVNPILGMHVSGMESSGRGIGVDIYSDIYMVQAEYEFEDTDEDTRYYGDDCNLQYLASVPSDMAPFIPNKTALVPSLISKHFPYPSGHRPAILSSWDPDYNHTMSPIIHGIRKNGKPSVDFPKRVEDWAYTMVSDLVLSPTKVLRTPSVLTMEESITGLDLGNFEDDVVYFGALPLDTSAGWPYSTSRYQKEHGVSGTSKNGWIQVEYGPGGPTSCTVHPKLVEDHMTYMKMRAGGIMAPNVFQDCLKDEKRVIAKALKEGGTRLISASNIEGSIALRRYTLDLTSYLKLNRIANGMAVGINPESAEWTILAQTVRRNGDNCFSLDFTNFGAGLNYSTGMRFAQLAQDFMTKFGSATDGYNTITTQLVRELMCSVHVADNLLYRTVCGSPSGAVVTVEMNSFVHLMYAAMSWCIIGEVWNTIHGYSHTTNNDLLYPELVEHLSKQPRRKLDFSGEAYRKNVVGVVYGDDGLYGVSDSYRDIFNAVTINLVLKEHKIGVTDATKSATITAYGPLSEMSFLKREFVPHELLPNTHYMARLDWSSVEECARWVHSKPLSPRDAVAENVEASLYLSWGWGSAKYQAWQEQLNNYLSKEGILPIRMTWEDVAIKFYDGISIN